MKIKEIDMTDQTPIKMVLHCPVCGFQHLDRPNHWSDKFDAPMGTESVEDLESLRKAMEAYEAEWTNPPHRSHTCLKCGTIWRPADVSTMGVWRVDTKGKADTWISDNLFGLPDHNHVSSSIDEEKEFTKWFMGEQGKPYDGFWEFAKSAWYKRALLTRKD